MAGAAISTPDVSYLTTGSVTGRRLSLLAPGRPTRARCPWSVRLAPSETLGLQLPHSFDADRGGAALVDAGFLRLGDTFEPTLAAKVRFEFGKDAEHVEDRLDIGLP